MPRSGWKKPSSDRRVSDLVSIGVLMRVFDPGVVDEVIAGCGRTEQRVRALPARSMAYFAMGMALHSEGSYEDVLALISDGLSWAERSDPAQSLPTKAAISHARVRLGPEPMAKLFERVAKPLAAVDTPGCWLAGRRVVAIDGTCLDLADSPANDEFFGRPGVTKGERSAFPQARLVALAECGTHAIIDAVIGPYTTSETVLSRDLLGRLGPGMLCLADRAFYGFAAWQQAAGTGADLLWRVKDTLILAPVKDLADGSWLAEVAHSTKDRRRLEPTTVRVIAYTVEDGRDPVQVRLVTTLTDPVEAPALELAAAYAQRWEIESVLDELKTHQRGPRAVLRSQSPDLVLQEIWGHLCCHYAIRALMFDAAATVAEILTGCPLSPPCASLAVPSPKRAPFPPERTDVVGLWRYAIGELVRRLLPARRVRANPRVVKRKYTRWHVKRDRHRDWPQPDRTGTDAVVITAAVAAPA